MVSIATINRDYSMLKLLCQMTEEQLITVLTKYLTKHNYKPIACNDYILAGGDIPILLIAHIDTVFESLPTEIYFDEQKKIMWSPQGLGADDRAGVYAILKIIEAGYRPHILFANKEEDCCAGSIALSEHFENLPFKCKYAIELDRQGVSDCVFYACDNKKFQSYVESFGFITAKGTYTDISVIGPWFDLAAVNLSIGYVDEHSFIERLHLGCLQETVNKVIKMLEDVNNITRFYYCGED